MTAYLEVDVVDDYYVELTCNLSQSLSHADK